jgi:hypothetical protein
MQLMGCALLLANTLEGAMTLDAQVLTEEIDFQCSLKTVFYPVLINEMSGIISS